MNGIQFVKATETDLLELFQIWMELIRYHENIGNIGGFRINSLKMEGLKNQLSKELSHDKFLIVIAKQNQQIVGFLKASQMTYPDFFEDNIFCLVHQIYVREPWQGSGIGKEMIQLSEDWCRDRGIKRLQLSVNSENLQGLRFYENMGFEEKKVIMLKNVENDRGNP